MRMPAFDASRTRVRVNPVACAPVRASPLPPPLWMLVFAAGMWALHRYCPALTVFPQPWNTLGWCVAALAAIAPLTAFIQFWRARTTINPHRPEAASTLVTSGVYAWTRNPMYLGLALLLLGWAIRLGTLTPFAGPLLFVLLIQRVQIRPEEHALRAQFGADYERYCGRVNRWLGPKAAAR
jgi:protein-S-isoprenylcysteine O-methyltransferase Ste14